MTYGLKLLRWSSARTSLSQRETAGVREKRVPEKRNFKLTWYR
jgi:hypothetical protein